MLCVLWVSSCCCRLQLGLTGAALAFSCSQATTAVLLTLYAIVRDARMAAQQHEQATWCKPSLAMFAGGGHYTMQQHSHRP